MKKIITLLLAMTMLLSLTACKAKEPEKKQPETMGEALLMDFEERTADKKEQTVQELADGLLTNSWIKFSGASMAVEEGYLTGFGNAEITGFKEGVMFGPVIGTIPFVGYVFETADEAGAETLLKTLTENADPRWNICTEAEETVSKVSGNKVFFVMCPKKMEN